MAHDKIGPKEQRQRQLATAKRKRLHDYGPNLGFGPTMRPTNPHPDSPVGRRLAKLKGVIERVSARSTRPKKRKRK